MTKKYLKYLRTSYYLTGLGIGLFLAAFAVFEYSAVKGWLHAGLGVVCLIIGAVMGTLAQGELKKEN